MKVAIASGKGGTGKTTLAVNLAAYMAQSERVVLVDLDVEEPNDSLFLDAEIVHREAISTHVPQWREESCDFCGRCQEVCNFHAVLAMSTEVMLFPELCHGCYACSELCPHNALPMVPRRSGELLHLNAGYFHFVEGRLDVGQEQAVPVISRTLDYVHDRFSDLDYFSIFDSPPGTACPVAAATRDADFVILVTEPTPFGLHDLTLAAELMEDLEKDFAVVVNRDGIGNDNVFAFCKEKSIEVIARIPNKREIAELCSSGELLFHAVPEVRSQLEKVTKSILRRNRQRSGRAVL